MTATEETVWPLRARCCLWRCKPSSRNWRHICAVHNQSSTLPMQIEALRSNQSVHRKIRIPHFCSSATRHMGSRNILPMQT